MPVCRRLSVLRLELEGKVAVVTGASRGIGRAIAETLSGEGMKVLLVARSAEDLERAASSLG
ncbi:MAG: SDR family NAD(P)-dependent oxidoreductase, partial [Thermoanaerobaculia bacterium]